MHTRTSYHLPAEAKFVESFRTSSASSWERGEQPKSSVGFTHTASSDVSGVSSRGARQHHRTRDRHEAGTCVGSARREHPHADWHLSHRRIDRPRNMISSSSSEMLLQESSDQASCSLPKSIVVGDAQDSRKKRKVIRVMRRR